MSTTSQRRNLGFASNPVKMPPLISRAQIENLPLNRRNFLELAKLETFYVKPQLDRLQL